jgi:cytochrome c553
MGPPIARITVIAAVLLTFAATPAMSGDIAAGRQKAVQCQACHGLDGLSKLPDAPHIAGQPEPYLIKSLNDYRKGIRKNELMTIVVKALTDRDVADIAAYYSAIEVTAKPPQ